MKVWIKFCIAAVIFLAFALLAYGIGFDVNNALILATGLVLLFYTLETQAIRLEMVRQNEISIQPVLIAGIEIQADNRNRIVLRNIGRGPALFIQPMDIKMSPELDANLWLDLPMDV